MNRGRRGWVPVALCSLLGACALRPEGEQNRKLDVHPGGVANTQPALGMGFDSLARSLTGFNCLDSSTVSEDPPGTVESSFSIKNNLDANELLDDLEADVGVSIPVYPGIALKGSLRLASEYSRSDFASNLSFRYEAKTRGFALEPRDRLSPFLESHLAKFGSVEALRPFVPGLCGDEFVRHVTYGVRLNALLKVEFQNEYDRRAFGGSLGASFLGGLVEITGKTDLSHVLKRAGVKVSVYVEQAGGQPERLMEILTRDAQGQRRSAFVECSNIRESDRPGAPFASDTCLEIFNSAIAYSKKLDEQLKQTEGRMPEGTGERALGGPDTLLAFETSPYPFFGNGPEVRTGFLYNRPYPDPYATPDPQGSPQPEPPRRAAFRALDPVRKQLREAEAQGEAYVRRAQVMYEAAFAALKDKLAQVGEAHADDVKRAKALLSPHVERIALAKARLSAIRNASDACWSKAAEESAVRAKETCTTSAEEVLAQLNPGGRFHLSPKDFVAMPVRFQDWCRLRNENASALNSDDLRVIGLLSREANGANPSSCQGEGRLMEGGVCYGSVGRGGTEDQCLAQGPGNLFRDETCFSPVDTCSQDETLVATLSSVYSLSGNKLTVARPLASLVRAKEIDLSGNLLTELPPLGQLAELETLNMSGNLVKSVESFARSAFSQVSEGVKRKLNLSGNLVEDANLLFSWKESPWSSLDLSGNRIRAVTTPVVAAALEEVDLSGNKMLEDVSGFAQPAHERLVLKLSGTRVARCPFEQTSTRYCIF